MLRFVSYPVPYKAPENPTGTATSSNSIFVKWDAADLPIVQGILRGYTVYYEEASSSVHPSVFLNVTVDISVTEVQLINLYKYTEYHIWVTAFTTRQGLKSISLFVRTLEDSKMYLFLFSTSSSEVGFMVYFGVFLLCFIKAVAPPFSGSVPSLIDTMPFYVMPAYPPPAPISKRFLCHRRPLLLLKSNPQRLPTETNQLLYSANQKRINILHKKYH